LFNKKPEHLFGFFYVKIYFFLIKIYFKKINMNNIYNADLTSGISAFETKNFALSYQLLAPLAATGDGEALFRVGMMQMNGLGMVEDQIVGFNNLKNSAQTGHGFAKHMVGVAYMRIKKDINQAINYFEQAVALNLPGAMMTLGMIYEEGKDIEKDMKKAKYYYDLADNA
jgi:TPR repeat protein